jgi:type 1 glutamine amidotransferase
MIATILALTLASTPAKVESGPPKVEIPVPARGGGTAKVDLIARIDHAYPPARDVRRPDWSIEVDASAIAYSPDGRTVATGGRDAVVRIWQARTGEDLTGELLHTFEGQTGRITALGWRGDSTLVAVSDKGTVMSWDVTGGKTAPAVTLKTAPRNLVLRPGKEPLLAGLMGSQVDFWNHETGEPGRTLAPKDARLRVLAFGPDGKRLAAGTDRGAVRVWDADSGALVRTFEAGGPVRAVAVSLTHVAAGLASGVVRLWALEGSEARELHGHKGAVTTLAFAAKGEQLGSGGADRLIRVWDVGTGQLLCVQQAHTAEVRAVAFNPNGQKMASVGGDGSLRYWTVPLPPVPAADLQKIEAALPDKATAPPKKPRKLLVFWRADAILHKGGVPAANVAILRLGQKTGAFEAHFTRDVEALDPKVLAGYDGIVLNSTAHLVMPEGAKKALLEYVEAGGGVIGIHAAIDTFKDWPAGAKIVGATFGGHPWGPAGNWQVKLDEPGHPLLRAWGGKGFKMHDEFYELAAPYYRANRRVLMSLDLGDPATAGVTPLHRPDRDFAVSWIKKEGKGRVFYCMFGHIGDPFQNRAVLEYYLDGIQYALGDLDVDASPRK